MKRSANKERWLEFEQFLDNNNWSDEGYASDTSKGCEDDMTITKVVKFQGVDDLSIKTAENS